MSLDNKRDFLPLGIAVMTVSDTRIENDDHSGKLLVERVKSAGHHLQDKKIVVDDKFQIRAVICNWCIEKSIQVILVTGGTGVTGRDGTPEAVTVLLDKVIDGFGEVFRAISYQKISSSTIQSRAIAGVANGKYIFCMPGSTSACATAWDEIISKQIDYRVKPCNLVELMPRLLEK